MSVEYSDIVVEHVELFNGVAGQGVRGVIRDKTLPNIAENRLKWAVSLPEAQLSMSETIEYWKGRCRAVEHRMDQLEREVRRLKGCKPISSFSERGERILKRWYETTPTT